jgi:hypothetical protein
LYYSHHLHSKRRYQLVILRGIASQLMQQPAY